MNRRRVLAPLAVAGGAFALLRLLACQSEAAPFGPEADTGVPSPSSSPPWDAARESGLSGDSSSDPYAKWEKWNEFLPGCETYVAPSRDLLPPPIRWEPCQDTEATRGLACRRAAVDWEIGAGGGSSNVSGMMRDDGSVVLSLLRFPKQGFLDLLVEPDGKVLSALFQKEIQGCRLNGFIGDGDRYLYRLSRDQGEPSALIGGNLADWRPSLVKKFDDPTPRGLAAGNPAFIEKDGALKLYDWTSKNLLDTILSPDGRAMENVHYSAGLLSFVTGELSRQALWTYSPGLGTKLFRTFGNDDSRGVADLGTDGKDWVWMEGYDFRPGDPTYPHVRMMTAKVTTDGSPPVVRYVRDGFVGYPFGTMPVVVGCGYAARLTAVQETSGKIIQPAVIVRLQDGVTHYVDTLPPDATSFARVVGLTCDEVFFAGSEKVDGTFRPNVFRVRLDSFGPGRLLPAPGDGGL